MGDGQDFPGIEVERAGTVGLRCACGERCATRAEGGRRRAIRQTTKKGGAADGET